MAEAIHNESSISNTQNTIPDHLQQNQDQEQQLNQQSNLERRSFFKRLLNGQIQWLSKKNVLKGVFLIIVFILTVWMASNFLTQAFVKGKTPTKFGSSNGQVNEVAAPDQKSFRSYYYFQKMVQLAKNNVKNNITFDYDKNRDQQLRNIGFFELYGLFKVVKAIQLANNYEGFDKTEKEIDLSRYQNIDNLTAAVNLTQFFNPVKNQANCASCYSFPITATVQYLYYIKTGKKISFSEQELIDCSNPDPLSNGCNSGNVTQSFQYVRDVGLVQEQSYPYVSADGISKTCKKQEVIKNENITKYKIKGFKNLPNRDCKAIQYQLVVNNKPVASMISTGNMAYDTDFSKPFRDCPKNRLNHAIVIVGQTQKQDWIVRNSWGDDWANNGYFIIKKGNTCGICSHATVPYLEGEQDRYQWDQQDEQNQGDDTEDGDEL